MENVERSGTYCFLLPLDRQYTPSQKTGKFKYKASGYLAEIEKMHAEVMEYLSRHASDPMPAEAA